MTYSILDCRGCRTELKELKTNKCTTVEGNAKGDKCNMGVGIQWNSIPNINERSHQQETWTINIKEEPKDDSKTMWPIFDQDNDEKYWLSDK